MVIAGPTQSGKTTWMNNLIHHPTDWIQPSPQRIVWCYSQWQPMYDSMPGVQFVKGLPPNLEDDGYFDLRVRNLLILDDLMSEAGKDQRVTHLYTRGSHHRNLSVITLMQNFFGSGTTTIRRNSHYLVLFDMPADKQEIYTIAQQMFPGNRKCLLQKYEEATSIPYGRLVVINKPNMQPQDRLLVNPTPGHTIKGVKCHSDSQLDVDHQAVNISQSSKSHSEKIMASGQCNMQQTIPREESKFHPCDECGLVYGNLFDLHRHIRKCGVEPPTKKQRIQIDSEEKGEEESDLDDVENDTFKWMWDEARDDATPGQEKKEFFKIYKRFLTQAMDLRKDKTTNDILNKADVYMKKGWKESKAIKAALQKHKAKFEDLFEESSEEEETEEEVEEDKDI